MGEPIHCLWCNCPLRTLEDPQCCDVPVGGPRRMTAESTIGDLFDKAIKHGKHPHLYITEACERERLPTPAEVVAAPESLWWVTVIQEDDTFQVFVVWSAEMESFRQDIPNGRIMCRHMHVIGSPLEWPYLEDADEPDAPVSKGRGQ